jgi:HlyD family secretion protein
MRDRNRIAFAAVALILGVAWLSSIRGDAGDANDHGFVSSAHAQPEPIRRLIDWLRGLTMPAGIVKAEGRVEATQIDVSSKYAGEVVDVAVEEGDKVAAGQLIARLSSPQLDAQLRAAQSDLRSAKEARRQDAIKAAEAKVEQIKSMIGELTLVSPRVGKVQYQLAHAGDSVAAGAPIVTLIDLTDVYMTVFVRAADAGKLAMGDEARIILDAAPDYVVPATVGFVASNAQSAPKAAETKGELLRVDLKIDQKVVETYYGKVETGLRSAGFVRTRPQAKWPADLQVKLPPAPVAQEPKPAPAPLAQEAAPPSAPTGGTSTPSAPAAAAMSAAVPAPVAEASTPEPAKQAAHAGAPASVTASAPVAEAAAPVPPPPAPSQRMSAPAPAPLPAPSAEASRSSPAAREAKLAPPPPHIPAPPSAPAHAPAAQASMSAGLGPEPGAEFAPESLAQLAGAWTQSAADCKKLFQRRGSAVAYRQPVDRFAQAAIIESQRIRLPTGVCRLERASHESGALKVSGECQDSISYTSRTAYVKLRSKNEIVFNPNGDPALDTSMTRCPL